MAADDRRQRGQTAPKTPPSSTRRLGRGLEALLGARPAAPAADHPVVEQLAIGQIEPNPLQPRREFKEEELSDLRESMRSSGLLQPVTVRPSPGGAAGYQLIAGERRWRAAQALGWTHIPGIVRPVDDQMLLALALVENLQRSDLDPLEEATGYRQLIDQFGVTATAVAQLIGKSRSTVANSLRLLELPDAVKSMLRAGELSVGQVRPLLSLGDHDAIVALAAEVRDRRLPARAVEQRAATSGRKRQQPGRPAAAARDPNVRALEDELRRRFQTDVKLTPRRGGGGDISLRFYSVDDLQRLLEQLGIHQEP